MEGSLSKRFIYTYIFLFCLLIPAFSYPDSLEQSNKKIITNKFISDKKGNLYLIFKTDLYRNNDTKGDIWFKISSGIKQVVFDHSDVNILYAITTNNLIKKSMDKGKNWITIISGLPDTAYNTITIDPSNNHNLYVGTQKGLYKSANAGFSWNITGLIGNVLQFEIKNDLESVYFGLTTDGLYISKASDERWRKIYDSLPKTIIKGSWRTGIRHPLKIYSIFITHIDRLILFILSTEGIFKSNDIGTNWYLASNGIDTNDIKNGFTSIHSNNKNIYLGTDGFIYKSENEGKSWKKIILSTMETEISDIKGIYEHQNLGGIFLFDQSEKILFFDKNHSLIGLNYGVLPHSKILALGNSHKNNKTIMYTIVYNNNYTDIDRYGLFYSSDNCRTWHKSLLYKPYVDWTNWDALRNIFISPYDEHEIWLFDKNTNFFTFNKGGKWEKIDFWPVNNNKVFNFDFDNTNEKIRYICTGNLFRFDLNTLKATSLNVKAKDIIQAEDDSNKLLAGFNISIDGGWTWKDLYPNLKKFWNKSNRYSLNSLYFSGNKIILFINGSRGANLISSNNLGINWKPLNSNKSSVFAYLNPYNPENLYLGIEDSKKKAIKLLQSKDQGLTWKSYVIYEPSNWDDAKRYNIRMMIVKGVSKNTTYVATIDGLYRSLNEGVSWELLGGIRYSGTKLENRSKISSLTAHSEFKENQIIGKNEGRLLVQTIPEGARIRILNIKPKFEQGMLLLQGKYLLEVSLKGYKTKKPWTTIETGEKKTIKVSLSK